MPTREELYNEADQLKNQGKLEEAVEKAREAIAADETYALPHALLAVVLGKLGQHDQAIEHAKKVAELEPDDSFSFTALSVVYQRAGYIQEAEDAMARARMIQQGF